MTEMGQFEDLRIGEGMEKSSILYNEIAMRAEKLVHKSYRMANRPAAFPIEIDLIAHHLGIAIQRENLNPEGITNFSKKLAVTTATSDGVKIVVDTNVSYKTRRYAIANGVGRYLLNESQSMLKYAYAIPLIPQSLEEIAADSIAIFLLLPVTLFKDEFLRYLNTCKECPLDVDVWLEHLSNVSQITPFNLAIGYQQMKQVLCYQRQMEFAEYDYDVTKMSEDYYEKIFS
jgi:hypothetical protein